MTQIEEQTGIPRSTFGDYVRGRISDLDRIAPGRLKVLYDLTGLDCFKYEVPKIEMLEPGRKPEYASRSREKAEEYVKADAKELSEIARQGKARIDKVVEKIAEQLRGGQRLGAGLLKYQQYKPSVHQRTEAIMELLDVLGEEVDYFRTAPENEKKVLVDRLQSEPESFGYVTQMLNIIYSGKKIDSWMLMAQPPSKIKKLTKRDK
jgi:hypothetical protein